MAHIQLVGMAERMDPGGAITKFPYAFPIIISQLRKTAHSFDLVDTHLHRLTDEELFDQVPKADANIFGISAWSHNYLQVKELTSRIRKVRPDATIVVGGIISGHAEALLKHTDTDMVCTSAEGEFVMPAVLDALDSDPSAMRDVPGLVIKDHQSGTFIHTPDRRFMTLKEFQKHDLPAYDYFDEQLQELTDRLNARTDVPVPGFPLLTMRGCPFKCTFCGHLYGHRMLKKRWGLFFDEVEYLVDRYGAKGFFCMDTNFLLNERDAISYCDQYEKRGASFGVVGGLRMTFGNPDLYERLYRCGLKVANYGLETGSQRMLNLMRKGTDSAKMYEIIDQTLNTDMLIHGNFIFGTPGENAKTVRETRKFMLFINKKIHEQKKRHEKSGVLNTAGYGWTILVPSPTSDLYGLAQKKGEITDEEKYLESLCDESFFKLLKGSLNKISLAQEAGRVNLSEFSSRKALIHYVKYNWSLVEFLSTLFDFKEFTGNLPKAWKSGVTAVKHLAGYGWACLSDFLHGRKGVFLGKDDLADLCIEANDVSELESGVSTPPLLRNREKEESS